MTTILERGALDTPAAALICTASLAEVYPEAQALLDSVEQALRKTPVFNPDNATSTGAPLPEQTADLVAELSEYITAQPCWTGRELARLRSLSLLWPHATRAERMQLRRLWFMGFNSRKVPAEAVASRDQLCTWQSRLPTVYETDEPSVNTLAGLLEARNAEQAYHEVAIHLHPHVNITNMCWVLGVLAQQVLLHRFDREGLSQSAFIGASMCRGMIDLIPPETALVLLSQIGHQIWWCRNEAGLRGLKAGNTDYGLSFSSAVKAGDYTAAQRAARQAAVDCRTFWPTAIQMTKDVVDQNVQEWARAALGLSVTGIRCAGQPVAPDDAATLGASLAAVHWLTTSDSVIP